jgi:hypothetical protein
MSNVMSKLGNGVLVLCAVVMTGMVVRKELRPEPTGGKERPSTYAEWKGLSTAGPRVAEPVNGFETDWLRV